MFLIIVSILGILGVSLGYAYLWIAGGFNAQIWWVHPVCIVLILALALLLMWKLEDEYGVLSAGLQRKEEGRSAVCPKIKYRTPYRLKKADEKFNDYEYAKYLLQNAKQGGRDAMIALAKKGFAPAQAFYGYALVSGEYGFPKEEKIGLEWLRQAEERNCPVAYTYLYYAYLQGEGVKKNEKKAKEYLQKALEIEYPIPEALIAKGYELFNAGDETGAKKYFEEAKSRNANYGVEDLCNLAMSKELLPAEAAIVRENLKKAVTTNKVLRLIAYTYEWQRDFKKAAQYFLAAAAQGDDKSKKDLALYYLNGLGVAKNEEKAESLYLSLAAKGDIEACAALGSGYAQGRFGETDLVKGEKYAKLAAESGEGKYLYQLAEFYTYLLFERKKAKPLYKQAAEDGYAPAQAAYGECLILENKEKQGLEWLIKAAEQGDKDGQYRLGRYYQEKKELYKAFKCFVQAAEQGHVEAQYETALACGKGHGTKIDTDACIRYMRLAAEGDNWQAQFHLSEFYKNGVGVEENAKLAAYWAARSEENLAKIGDSSRCSE